MLFAAAVAACSQSVFGLALNHDAAGFLLDAEATRAGLRLYADFFEINTPSNMWLPAVTLALSRTLPFYVADIHVAVLFAFVVASASLSLYVLWQFLSRTAPVTVLVAALLIPVTLLWYPLHDFGQREPLFLAAMMPYGVIILGRHAEKSPAPLLSIVAGLLAAFGASLKPHFLLLAGVLLLLELILRRGKLTRIGLESYVLAGSLAAYVASIAFFHPVYFTEMLPIASASLQPVKEPLSVTLGILGARRMTILGVPILLLLAIIIWLRPRAARGPGWQVLAFAVVALISALAIYLGQSFGFRYHQLIFTPLLILTAGFSLAFGVDQFLSVRGASSLVVASLACLAVTWFVADTLNTIERGPSRRDIESDRLVSFLRGLPPGTPVLWVGSGLAPMSPMAAYSNVRSVGRYSSLVPVRAIVDDRANPKIAALEGRMRQYVENSFADGGPEYIVVDASQPLRWFETYGKPFSLIQFLCEQPGFAERWTRYEKIADMVSMNFSLEIFRRRGAAR